jgi:hypothetical protein
MGYNTGDTYEEKIFDICKTKGITPVGSTRAGAAGNKADVEFIHLGKTYKLEVKNNKNPDYGQKRMHLDVIKNSWLWAKPDSVTQFYNQLNVTSFINSNFNPIWYQKKNPNATFKRWANKPNISSYDLIDLKSDQRNFEKRILIPLQSLFSYYKNRDTYYIQIEGSGFYHLDSDIAKLGTQQYKGELFLRFRVKHTGHSRGTADKCQFMAVLKQKTKSKPSLLNIEKTSGQTFPKITP